MTGPERETRDGDGGGWACGLSPRELADVLYAAAHARRLFAPPVVSSQPETEEPNPEGDSIRDEILPPKRPEKPSGVVSPPERPQVRLYDKQPGSSGDAEVVRDAGLGTISSGGESVTVPEAILLPDARDLARALRPLHRRVRRGPATELDPLATVEATARNGGHLCLVKRPPERRWISLNLVFDTGRSMEFWDTSRRGIASLFSRQGAFRDLRLWRMSAPAATVVPWNAPDERGAPDITSAGIEDQVILVLTDTLGPHWRSGAAQDRLRVWGERHHTALLHLFPDTLWRRTALRQSMVGELASPRALAPNRLFTFTRRGRPVRDARAGFPVINLRAGHFRTWARFVAGLGESRIVGILPGPGQPEETEDLPPEVRLNRFFQGASREAGELARCLAAAPLSPPVMRLIQAAWLPDTRHWHLAEVVFGNLLRPVELKDERVRARSEGMYFEFHPDLRDLLLRTTPKQRFLDVRLKASEYLRRLGFGEDGFPLLLEHPDTLPEPEPEGRGVALPVAALDAAVFGQLGERYAAVASRFRRVALGGSGTDGGSSGGGTGPDDRPETLVNSVGMTMIGIPSGTFWMGSPEDEPGRDGDDFARHEVTLSATFRIAATPVTQAQYEAVVGTNPSHSQESGLAAPVELVSWADALRFCDALTARDRAAGLLPDAHAYALPTEAQWEYACRAGTHSPYNVDGADPSDLGWFRENSGNSTHPVGEKAANDWGLYDCHGNVWEWCADWFGRSTSTEPATDPQGQPEGEDRVLRGGSWFDPARYCRSADRLRRAPGYRDYSIGFRPVLIPAEQREGQGVFPPEPEVQEEADLSVRPHFVPIKAGTFLMGSPGTEKGRLNQEHLHPVTLTRDFEIADAPVTQAQYEAVMGTNPSHFKESGADAPVEQVSWDDAVAFCEKLSAKDPDWIYRLPTEAEWEYACRAGNTGRYNVRGADLADVGWFEANSGGKTHPVREKALNAWELYDCHGNVWEWCADWFTAHLGTEPTKDPQGPASGGIRVLRGGSWDNTAQRCRSAARSGRDPSLRRDYFGFRPVRMKKAEGHVLEAEAQPEPEAGARSSAWIARDFPVPNAPGMKMLCLGHGNFTMGEGSEAHPVTLTEDFFIAETPVTQAQFEAVMGTNPSCFKAVGPDAPVERVSWEDAMAFCARLNEVALPPEKGWEWSLPTEAQWEYACRAGTTTAFSFGDEDGDLRNHGWYGGTRTHPVRRKRSNPWGLFDAHGNVWEWCADWYGAYSTERVSDPQGPESGGNRVLRGGSWRSNARSCRSAARSRDVPDIRHDRFGFRPVLTRKNNTEGTEPEAEGKPEPATATRSRRADYVAEDFTNAHGMGMVCLEPGTFHMGSPPDEVGRESTGAGKETRHEVSLTERFWAAAYLMTQGVWRTLMGTTVAEQKAKGTSGDNVTGTGDDHPMYFVNWEEALAACDRLSIRERAAGRLPDGYLYTLPSEAQWEYGCRGGTEGAYNVDGANLADLGWFEGNSGSSTHPVGAKRPNGWGLHDCHGNVWEWCADWYQNDLGTDAATDPQGPKRGVDRVLRGGSWYRNAQHCRSAYRYGCTPGHRSLYVGFRPVLAPRKQRTDLAVLPAELEAVAQPEPEAGQIRPVFVPILPGKFLMGSPRNEDGRFPNETQHKVTLTHAFEIADAPVTQAQYEAVMGTNPSRFKESGPDAPVEQVTWEDSLAWCRKMSEADRQYEYRLPTEAEWEYACRAGTKGSFNVDDVTIDDLGWYSRNSSSKTHPVKQKPPNAWGLHDCHGNVVEWCADWYQENLGAKAVTDPKGPPSGAHRLLRGGSWYDSARNCRSANRAGSPPDNRDHDTGFRPVRIEKTGDTGLDPTA